MDAKNINVLIVDDEIPNLKLVKYQLEKLGFNRVFEACDGETAYQRLQGEEIGLVISDWHMPGFSGLELLERVKKNSELRHIPFLMVTSDKQKDSIIQAAKAGVDHYIVKPFDGETLRKKIKDALEAASSS